MDNKDKEKVLDEEKMTGVAGGTSHMPAAWVNGVDGRRCTKCEICIELCREHGEEAISLVNGAVSIDKSKCVRCRECMLNCPEHCIDIDRLFG